MLTSHKELEILEDFLRKITYTDILYLKSKHDMKNYNRRETYQAVKNLHKEIQEILQQEL